MIDANFKAALAETLRFEGGYVNNPNDRGGPTNYGITESTARRAGYTGPMESIPSGIVEKIYHDEYWEKPNISKLSSFLPQLAAQLFDIGVNMGPGTAVKFLQTALNYLGIECKVDGQLGPKTIDAVWKLSPAKRQSLRLCVGALHARHYLDICDKNPSQNVFLAGWLKRVRMN